MKNQVVLVLVILGVVALCQAQDHVSSLLRNRPYVEKGISCVLDQGPCDSIGRQVKRVLPEALNNDCRRCTAYQARTARRLIPFMQTEYPNEWRMIVERYSSQGY